MAVPPLDRALPRNQHFHQRDHQGAFHYADFEDLTGPPDPPDTGQLTLFQQAGVWYQEDDAGSVGPFTGGGGSGNLDGGSATSTYGGVTAIDGGNA